MNEIILKYLSVFISYPFTILVLGIIALCMFKRPVSDLIKNVKRGTISNVSFEIEQFQSGKIEMKTPEEALRLMISQNPDKLINEYNALFWKYMFEKIYNVIFGTQLLFLERLYIDTNGTITINDAIESFRKYESMLIVPNNIDFENYMLFFKNYGLASFNSLDHQEIIHITDNGKKFIEYIRNEYSPFYRNKIL